MKNSGVKKIVGKRIKGVVLKKLPDRPHSQLFLVFSVACTNRKLDGRRGHCQSTLHSDPVQKPCFPLPMSIEDTGTTVIDRH